MCVLGGYVWVMSVGIVAIAVVVVVYSVRVVVVDGG